MPGPRAATNAYAHPKNQVETMEKFFDRKRLVRCGFALLLLTMGLLIGAGFAKSARQWQQAQVQSPFAAMPLSC